MPLLKIQTNRPIDNETQQRLATEISAMVASMLGKSERYVMVIIESGEVMTFSGETGPCAYLELKSIGLPGNRTAEFSAALCQWVSANLQIDEERIYIEFSDAARHMWGWNGDTF